MSSYKFLKLLSSLFLFCIAVTAFSQQLTLGTVADNITKSFEAVTKMLTAAAYVGGVMFFAVAIFQFKAHKENPTQIPLSKPMVVLAMATALIFLPTITDMTSGTFFGGQATAGGPNGTVIASNASYSNFS